MVLPRRDLDRGPDRAGEERYPHENGRSTMDRQGIGPRWPGLGSGSGRSTLKHNPHVISSDESPPL